MNSINSPVIKISTNYKSHDSVIIRQNNIYHTIVHLLLDKFITQYIKVIATSSKIEGLFVHFRIFILDELSVIFASKVRIYQIQRLG